MTVAEGIICGSDGLFRVISGVFLHFRGLFVILPGRNGIVGIYGLNLAKEYSAQFPLTKKPSKKWGLILTDYEIPY